MEETRRVKRVWHDGTRGGRTRKQKSVEQVTNGKRGNENEARSVGRRGERCHKEEGMRSKRTAQIIRSASSKKTRFEAPESRRGSSQAQSRGGESIRSWPRGPGGGSRTDPGSCSLRELQTPLSICSSTCEIVRARRVRREARDLSKDQKGIMLNFALSRASHSPPRQSATENKG